MLSEGILGDVSKITTYGKSGARNQGWQREELGYDIERTKPQPFTGLPLQGCSPLSKETGPAILTFARH